MAECPQSSCVTPRDRASSNLCWPWLDCSLINPGRSLKERTHSPRGLTGRHKKMEIQRSKTGQCVEPRDVVLLGVSVNAVLHCCSLWTFSAGVWAPVGRVFIVTSPAWSTWTAHSRRSINKVQGHKCTIDHSSSGHWISVLWSVTKIFNWFFPGGGELLLTSGKPFYICCCFPCSVLTSGLKKESFTEA